MNSWENYLFITKFYEISKMVQKTKQNVICSLWPVCACLAPVVSGLSSRAQQHHIDMKIAPQIIFYENVARGSGSIMASSNVISIPQSCKGVSYLKMCMDYFCTSNGRTVKIRVSPKHVRQNGWKIISVSAK